GFALLPERTAQPTLEGRAERPPAGSPDAARRNLHERHEIANGRGQRVLIASRPSLVQERAQLRARPRLLVDELVTQREQSLEVDAGELTPKGAGPLKEALERRLHHRTQRERVA